MEDFQRMHAGDHRWCIHKSRNRVSVLVRMLIRSRLLVLLRFHKLGITPMGVGGGDGMRVGMRKFQRTG